MSGHGARSAGRLLMGAMGPGIRGEHRTALEMLSLSGGERVRDVACGTGDFPRGFARASGDGVVVGLDASRTMLAGAVRQTDADNVTYLPGDACALPVRHGCFAALYLIKRPMQAVDEIARVLAPGGRVALLSSCNQRSRARRHHQTARKASPACACSAATS
jgi:ubiquinone/menaquinone biosynthesis C-methylase UbiE